MTSRFPSHAASSRARKRAAHDLRYRADQADPAGRGAPFVRGALATRRAVFAFEIGADLSYQPLCLGSITSIDDVTLEARRRTPRKRIKHKVPSRSPAMAT